MDKSRNMFLLCSMHDFSQKYRGVVHFGLWAEEGADLLGQHDAWAIIADAVKRSYCEDVRSGSLDDALDFLERFAVRKRPFEDFRKAIDIQSPGRRYTTMREAAERICKAISF